MRVQLEAPLGTVWRVTSLHRTRSCVSSLALLLGSIRITRLRRRGFISNDGVLTVQPVTPMQRKRAFTEIR